jgi:predicted metal-binding membrane protein
VSINHARSFVPLAAMWFGMMGLMMAPTVWPWVSTFNRMNGGGASGAAVFSSGYLAAWLLYAVAAASLQILLPHDLPRAAAAAILLIAGLFQFAPLKRACLMHCRNPLTYFLMRWRDGASGSFRMGMHHGLFCVACCWALMATTLAVGMTSLWWMAALAAMTFAEQVTPYGDRVRSLIGAALIAGSVATLAVR